MASVPKHLIAPTIALRASSALLALCVILFAVLTSAARADEPAESERSSPKLYVTGLAGGAWATMDAAGTTTADGDVSGSSAGHTAFGGGALGTTLDLGWSDLRLELEGTGGRQFTAETAGTTNTYVTTAKIATLQGDFWFEYSLDRHFPDTPLLRNIAPFAGGGLGLSHISLDSRGAGASGSDKSVKFAWQVGAGLAYQLSPRVVLETRYQYADLGKPSIGLATGGTPQGTLELDYGTHEVVGGLRFVFDPF